MSKITTYKLTTCKRCGAAGLHWEDTSEGWRLQQDDGTRHVCKSTSKPKDERKIIQIAASEGEDSNSALALCNDGTVWFTFDFGQRTPSTKLPPIPQPEDEEVDDEMPEASGEYQPDIQGREDPPDDDEIPF